MKKILFLFLSLLISCWDDVENIKDAPVFLNKNLQVEGAVERDSTIFFWAYVNGEVESFQWYKNNVLLNTNYDTLFIDSLSNADTGSYVLIVANNGGSDTSNIYRLVLTSDISLNNNKPFFVQDKPSGSYEVIKGTALKIPFSATDADSSDTNLSYWVISTHLPITSDTGTMDSFFIWNTDTAGVYPLTFNVTDGKDTTSKIIVVTIKEPIINDSTKNSIPQFLTNMPAPSYTISEGDTLLIPFMATDPDSVDTVLNYWIVSSTLPTPADTSTGDTAFMWYNPVIGEYALKINVSDGKDTAFVDVSVKVEEKNDGISLIIKGYTKGQVVEVNENDSLKLVLSATGHDSLELVEISFDTLLDNSGIIPAVSPMVWGYIPSYDVASNMNPVDTIPLSFIASGSNSGSDTFNIEIHVKNVNRKPVATGTVVAAIEETVTNIKVSTSDEDGDSLKWKITKLPTNGSVNIDSGITLTEISFDYTSKNSSTAINDDMEITINDGVDSIIWVVQIMVNADNDAPIITGQVTDTFMITEGIPFELTIDSIIVSDPDDSLSDLTFSVISGTGYSVNGNTIIVDEYTTSIIGIVISVKDDQNAIVYDTLIAKVTEVNDVPVINGNGTVQWYEDNTLDLSTVYFNITDSDDNSHTVFAIDGENYTIDANGNIITPKKNWDDSLSINVKATDGEDTSALYVLNLNLIPVNDTPIVTIGTPLEGPSVEFGGTFNIPIMVEDPEGIKSLKVYRNSYRDVLFTLDGDFKSDTIPWVITYSADIIGENEIKVVVVDSGDLWVDTVSNVNVIGNWISDSTSLQVMIDSNNMTKTFVGSFSMTKENGRISYLQLFSSSTNEFFSHFTADIGNLNALKTLEITNQNIKTFPSEFSRCGELDSLFISACNSFETFQSNMGSLSKLRSIKIMSCPLKSLPYTFGELSSLKNLFIVNTTLSSLPSSCRNLNLESLFLNSNELTSLPFVVGDLPDLSVGVGDFASNKLHPSDPAEDWALWLDSKFPNGRIEWYDGGNTQKP